MRRFKLRPWMFLVVVVCAFPVALTQFAVSATEPKFAIQALAEKKIDRLPAGPPLLACRDLPDPLCARGC